MVKCLIGWAWLAMGMKVLRDDGRLCWCKQMNRLEHGAVEDGRMAASSKGRRGKERKLSLR